MMTDPIADMLTRIRNATGSSAPGGDAHLQDPPRDRPGAEGRGLHLGVPEELDTLPAKTLRLHMKYGPNGERLITRIDRVQQAGLPGLSRLQGPPTGPGGHGHSDPQHPQRGRQ